MPTLPQVTPINPGGIGNVQIARVTPEQYGQGFRALGGLSETLRAIKEGDDAVKGTQALSDFAMAAEEAATYAKQHSDPDNHLQVWRQQVDQAKQQATSGLQGFSRERQVEFTQALDRLMGQYQRQAYKDQEERKVDRQVGNGQAAVTRLAEFASRAQNPVLRDQLLSHAGQVTRELVDNGALKETEAQRWMQQAHDAVKNGRVGFFASGLNGELDNLQNEAFRNPARADDLYSRGVKKIRQAGSDWLPAEKIDDAIARYRNGIYAGAIKTLIDEEPDRTKAELKAGKYDDKLDQHSLIALSSEADTEIERRKRKAEAERKERERLIGKEVDDFKTAVMSGFPWSGNVAALNAKVRGTEHEKEFLEAVRDSHELSLFSQMGPVQQESYLRLKAQTPKSGDEAKLYGKLEAAHERTKAGLKDDALTFAIRQRVIPALMPLDLNNPNSLKERSIAAGLVEQRYGVPVSPLSDDEAQALSQQLSRAPADAQVQAFRQLRQGLDDRYVKAIAAQLAKKKDDPVLAHAMGLSTESPEAASHIVRGREILRENKEILPKGADLKTAQDKIASALAEAYKNNPEHYSAVSDAAMAIYAYKSWQQRDLSGVIDTGRLDEAIREASGGVLTLGRFGSRYNVQPPRYGMDETGFADLLKRADYSKAKGMSAKDIQQHGIFESIGGGKYLVRVGPGYVQGEHGPFILDLNLPPRGASGATVGGAAGLVK